MGLGRLTAIEAPIWVDWGDVPFYSGWIPTCTKGLVREGPVTLVGVHSYTSVVELNFLLKKRGAIGIFDLRTIGNIEGEAVVAVPLQLVREGPPSAP